MAQEVGGLLQAARVLQLVQIAIDQQLHLVQ